MTADDDGGGDDSIDGDGVVASNDGDDSDDGDGDGGDSNAGSGGDDSGGSGGDGSGGSGGDDSGGSGGDDSGGDGSGGSGGDGSGDVGIDGDGASVDVDFGTFSATGADTCGPCIPVCAKYTTDRLGGNIANTASDPFAYVAHAHHSNGPGVTIWRSRSSWVLSSRVLSSRVLSTWVLSTWVLSPVVFWSPLPVTGVVCLKAARTCWSV